MSLAVTRMLVRASWSVVRGPLLAAPVAAAAVLVAATWPVLDDGYALTVLRGVGVLLAAAWVVAMDDPMGEVLGAAPYPRAVRWGTRALVAGAVVVPAWTAAAAVVEARAAEVPVLAVGLEALALAVAGLGCAGALRAWWGHLQPSYLAVVGIVVVALTAHGLPRAWAMSTDQVWGPPWEAAHLRWASLLLLGGSVLAAVLRDPWAGGAAGTVATASSFPGPGTPQSGTMWAKTPRGRARGRGGAAA